MVKRLLVWFFAIVAVLAVAVLALRWLFPVPATEGRSIENSAGLARDSRLARGLAVEVASHPGKSGVVELPNGAEALDARLFLIEQADASIDAQYYIWQDDTSGRLLLKALLAAADRGVKVRLLLDDNGVPGMDALLASLDGHDNISIRLFNPSTVRSPKMFGYAFDFFRMNRRMHNKALIVDGVASVIGGRNIGNIYFEVGKDTHYLDLDALAVGEIAADVGAEFDAYWNSASAIDARLVLAPVNQAPATLLAAPHPDVSPADELAVLAAYAGFKEKMAATPARLEWTDIKVIYDDTSKGLGKARPDQLLIHQFKTIADGAKKDATLASAYFVPAKSGAEYFANLARSGVKVEILTNSASANDVLLVHTGYLKYRERLLKAGVELFELKRLGPERKKNKIDIDITELGSSSSSLHAKTFALDRERIFIGSFNFDPRSAILNCEMGMMIESPRMARAMQDGFEADLRYAAYRPQMRDGKMIWVESVPGGADIIHETEPGMSFAQRFMLRAIGYLPIEWLL